LIKTIKEQCDTIKPWDHRALKTRAANEPLINGLLHKMVEMNYPIIKKVLSGSKVSVINWMRDIQPLSSEEIKSVCTQLSLKDPEYSINLLVDKGYFSGPPHLTYLLPNKPSELVNFFPYYLTWQEKLLKGFTSRFSAFLPMVGRTEGGAVMNKLVSEISIETITAVVEKIHQTAGPPM
jgi:hypothetical protein